MFPRSCMTVYQMKFDPGVGKVCAGTFSLTYVSQSTIPALMAADEIAGLVALSRERNVAHGVTGCLVFTGNHFAQLIEGPEHGVRRLMANIEQDPRHRCIEILESRVRNARQCTNWALGYHGPSRFVQRIIQRSLAERSSEAALGDLADLLTGLQTP